MKVSHIIENILIGIQKEIQSPFEFDKDENKMFKNAFDSVCCKFAGIKKKGSQEEVFEEFKKCFK